MVEVEWWWILLLQATFWIGVAIELEEGAAWDSTPVRLARMLGYSITWPLLALAALWYLRTFDDEELL